MADELVVLRKGRLSRFAGVPNKWLRLTDRSVLSVTATKLRVILLAQAQVAGKLGAWVTFTPRQVALIVSPGSEAVTEHRDYSVVRDALVELGKVPIDHQYIDEVSGRVQDDLIFLFQRIRGNREEGWLKARLSEPFRQFLATKRRGWSWARIYQEDVIQLQSTPQILLYELLRSVTTFRYASKRYVPVEQLRLVLGLHADYYDDWSRVRDYVLHALKQINQILETDFRMTTKRRPGQREVIGVYFSDETTRKVGHEKNK